MKRVLFICNHNAGRTQMAHAFFECYAPDDLRAESAGSNPARAVWPEVVEVMREVGIDLSDRRPKKLLPDMQLHADWAVTMGCDDGCPYVPTTVQATKLDAIRADRTAHELRLAQLLPKLVEEFEARHEPQEIGACADAILARYDDAPVHAFLQAIVTRQARECLRKDTCDVLAVSA